MTSLTKALTLVGIMLNLGVSSAQNSNNYTPQSTAKALTDYYLTNLQEKIYVITDKPYYAQSDTIWYHAYLVNAISHQPLTLSSTIYVDLINEQEEIIEQQILSIQEGQASGEFVIEEKQAPGTYMIRAYSQWMQNFDEAFMFKKEFEILNVWPQSETEITASDSVNQIENSTSPVKPKVTLSLYPEGGQLVNGIGSVVGVKSTVSGSPVAISGKLINKKSTASYPIKTDKYGIGMMYMSNPGDPYEIILDTPAVEVSYEWPEIKTNSYSLKIYNRYNAKNLMVVVETDIPGGLEGCYIVGHTRGEPFVGYTLQGVSNLSKKMISIPNSSIPTGVAHLTLFDPESRPSAERLIFSNQGDKIISPAIELRKTKLKPREKVSLDIDLGDTLGAFTTISVTNNSVINRSSDSENIGSYLLLSSDLKGEIDDPYQYFQTDNRESFARLDQLMLTHGWRRFTWQDVLVDSIAPMPIKWENGLSISGQLKDFVTRKKPNTGWVQIVGMSLKNKSIFEGFDMKSQYTDSIGRFHFNNFLFTDSVKFVISSKKSEKGKINRFYIDLDETPAPKIPAFSQHPLIKESQKENFIEKSNKQFIIEKSSGEQVIVLDEMQITAKRETKVKDAVRGRYMSPDYRLIADSILVPVLSLADYLRQIPFIFFDNDNSPTIRNQTPLIFLDGYEIDATFAMDYVRSMSADDIFFVDVDRQGMTSGRGIPTIYIYTKSGNGVELTPNLMETPGLRELTHPGFHTAREFYEPDYSTANKKPDYRLQLYWQPKIEIKNGKAHVEFYVGDDRGMTYDIILEGMTKSGKAIVGKSEFRVE